MSISLQLSRIHFLSTKLEWEIERVCLVCCFPPTNPAGQPATAKELLLHQARPARQGTLGWGAFRNVHTTHLPGRKNTQTAGKHLTRNGGGWLSMSGWSTYWFVPVNSIVLRDCYVIVTSLVDQPDGFVPSWAEVLWLQLAFFVCLFLLHTCWF